MLIFVLKEFEVCETKDCKDSRQSPLPGICSVPYKLIANFCKIQVYTIKNFSVACMQYQIYISHVFIENLWMENPMVPVLY